jgi:hypothetical protein
MQHLPVLDCLPYKPGKNIAEEMKIPAGAIPDSFAITFKYKKNGKTVEFDQSNFPADFDSTYEFIDRYDKLVRKGTATATITDFSLQNTAGNDTTLAILNQPNNYAMLMVKDFTTKDKWLNNDFKKSEQLLHNKQLPLFIVTADKQTALQLFGNDSLVHILICDATVIKTAARVNPTYIFMQQGNIKAKYSFEDADKIEQYITMLPAK